MTLTPTLKEALWKKYGTDECPAEWDGHFPGGGKLSQRFWEYMKSIELLGLNPDSVVLDIGGGAPKTGYSFLPELLAPHIKKVCILDPSDQTIKKNSAIEIIREFASFESIKQTFQKHPDISHVVSVSTFEHIKNETRQEIIRAVNEYFQGHIFVATFEYHAKREFFNFQLTEKSLSDCFSPFTNFYVAEIQASPVWCSSAYLGSKRVRNKFAQRVLDKIFGGETPAWYPLAIKFERNNVA